MITSQHGDTQQVDADLPLPAGATTDGEWVICNKDHALVRAVEWSRHDTDKYGISIDGWQYANGRVTCGIELFKTYSGFDNLTPDDARALAAKLIEAADAMDALQ